MQWQRVATYRIAAALRSTDRQGEGKALIAWQWNGEAKKCEEQQGRGIDRIRPATERRRKGQRRSGKVLLRMHWHGREKKCRDLQWNSYEQPGDAIQGEAKARGGKTTNGRATQRHSKEKTFY